jgi:sugar O-acyltransferase (sialic acid O-acetyltransferase NeuD family)
MKKIILIGGGGHCKSVIDVIEEEKQFEIHGIVDKPENIGSYVLGYEVIAADDNLQKLANRFKYALVTVGQIKSPALRIKLFNLASKAGFSLPSIISPQAYVSKHSSLGKGVVVMHHAVVNANTSIGDNCIINSKALIEHDCEVAEHCHISTNATINGGSKVGPRSFVGSNVTTKESIIIQEKSFIKAGSIVK